MRPELKESLAAYMARPRKGSPLLRIAGPGEDTGGMVRLSYICSGSAGCSCQGRPEFRLAQDELLITGPDSGLELSPSAGAMTATALIRPGTFSRVSLQAGGGYLPLRYLTSALLREELPAVCWRISGDTPVQGLLENLFTALLGGNEVLAQATLGLLLLQLACGDISLPYAATRHHAILLTLRELEENTSCADMSRVAEELGLTLPYLSSAVHSAMGATFKELLIEKRLSQAARLLEDTDLPIDEIITMVGYDNTSYFYRKFRERFGRSPKEFRGK